MKFLPMLKTEVRVSYSGFCKRDPSWTSPIIDHLIYSKLSYKAFSHIDTHTYQHPVAVGNVLGLHGKKLQSLALL